MYQLDPRMTASIALYHKTLTEIETLDHFVKRIEGTDRVKKINAYLKLALERTIQGTKHDRWTQK